MRFPLQDILPAAKATSADHHSKMASALYFSLFLCLTSGLWTGANARPGPEDEDYEKCPPGWVLSGNHCYKFQPNAENFNDAQAACVSLGANLAAVDNPEQYNFLKAMINKVSEGQIGDSDISKDMWMNFHQQFCVPFTLPFCGIQKAYVCAKSM